LPNPTSSPRSAQSRQPPKLSIRARLGALKNLPPFAVLVWQASRSLTLTSAALRLIRALLPLATLFIAKLIIDEVVLQAQAPDKPLGLTAWLASGRCDRLIRLLAAECALAVLGDVLQRIGTLVGNLLSQRVTDVTSLRLMQHASTLDLPTFENAGFQDQLERARRHTDQGMWLIGGLFGQLQEIITVISLVAALMVFAPWLVTLLAVSLIPAFLADAHFNFQRYGLDYRRAEERRELVDLRETAAGVTTAKEVKIFGLHGFLIARYRQLAGDFYVARRIMEQRRALWVGLCSGLGTAGYYVAFTYIVWRTLAGALSIGELTFLAAAFQRLRGLIESLLSGFSSTASQAQYLNDLFSFFAIKARITSPLNAIPFPSPIRQGFVFDDVGFKYPGSERWAVRHLSFTLKAGEVLALVGENGAGKTTIVKLLARLYDTDEGRILLDGHDLREYDLEAVRANMGVIFQDFVRYNLSVGDNIAVGQIDQRLDIDRIALAAEASGADGVVAKLGGDYGQMVGKRFKNGVELSGGEWQKVAIARAYMRDAQVLILDEPTAALDARAEYEVFQRFKNLSQGRTAVLISHRFSSVRMAECILVLADGRAEAQGTHAELMQASARYAELFELQAAGYR
jgi:ATP-binding cassette, subfamily B, bacterial